MRIAEKSRTTLETSVSVSVNLDGSGKSEIDTGIGFLNHMLEQLARHSGMDIALTAQGDLDVDSHHVTEDVAIVLGEALHAACGDGRGIERFAQAAVPMDEALVSVALDVSGRPHCSFGPVFPSQRIGDLDSENIREFFVALCSRAMITCHVIQLAGINSHHIAEASFKALARALRAAYRITGETLPTTKGLLT